VHPRLLPRDGDGLVLDIDAEDLAAGETRDAQRRPSRAAGDVDEARPRRGIQPAEERLAISTPRISQPVRRAMRSAGPPEPQAMSMRRARGGGSSQPRNVSSSSDVSQEF